jgi:hypothetical protein
MSDLPSSTKRFERPPVDELIRALVAPEPPPEPPMLNAGSRWPRRGIFAGAAMVALAAGVLLVLRQPSTGTSGMVARGKASEAPPPAVDLQIAAQKEASAGGGTVRLADGDFLSLGQPVYFRVSTERSTTVWVWVEGPSGSEPVASVEVGPEPRDIQTPAGHVVWSADRAGSHTIRASSRGAGVCEPGSCTSVNVEVKE